MNHLKPRFFSRTSLAVSLLLALLLYACGGDKPDAMLASARDYLAKNDSRAAVIQLKNALQKNPELAEARYLLGLALLGDGDAVGAETELRKALELKTPRDQVIPALARALLAQGQLRKLTDEFARTELSQATAKADLQTSLSSAYLALGKGDLARAALAIAVATDPTYAPALLAQVRERAGSRDFDAALALLESVLAKAPSNFEAWKLKGDILGARAQGSEAVAAYRKAVESKPDFVPAHAALFIALMQQENAAEASKQLDALKKVAPNSPQTKYLDAVLAYQKKDFKAARELSQQLLKMAPNSTMGLQLAGMVELQTNSLLQAEAYLGKVVQVAPESVVARRLLATTYLRSGQPSKALTALQPILKSEGLDAATNAIAGEVFLQNGDAKKAEEFFTRATKQDPKNAKTRTALALTHLAGGRDEAAFAELQDISTMENGSTADLALISALLSRREFDAALKAIDSLEKKQPDQPLAANLRGRTLLAKQDSAGAIKSFERSLAIDPGYFPAAASLAALDMADRKPEQARKRFETVLAKDPKNPQALLALAELSARLGATKDQVAELITRAITVNPSEQAPRLLLVELYLRNKDFKQALSAAQNAVAALPESAELLDALGRAQQATGDGNQALATFNKAAAVQPPSPMAQMRLADFYMAGKNKEAAIQSLRKALDIKPDLVEAQRALILLVMDGKNFQEASAIARNIQKQRPKEAVGYQLEGDVAANQKKWDVAAEAYRAGLKQAPFPALAAKLHTVLGMSGKASEADKFAAAWMRDQPKDVLFRLYLADLASNRQDYDAAEKMYTGIVRTQPNNAIALNNLAWVTAKLKKDGAVAYAEKAVSLVPDQAAYMDTLAMLLSEKNEYAKALEWQNKAIALQPQNGVFKINLVKIHIKGGKKDLARKELDELAKLGDKFQGQAEVASLLKSL